MENSSGNEKNALRGSQQYWLTSTREDDARYYYDTEKLPIADAYAKVTQSRTIALETYLKQLLSKDKTVTLEGKIAYKYINRVGIQIELQTEHGLYYLDFVEENTQSKCNVPQSQLDIINEVEDQDITVQVKGHLNTDLYCFDPKSIKVTPVKN